MKRLLITVTLLGILSLVQSQVCLQIAGSTVNVRKTPCGAVAGSMKQGQRTTYRVGVAPVSCVLSGTRYTWIPVAQHNGWIFSNGLTMCPNQCVRVEATSLNIRSSPCGGVSKALSRNTQRQTTSNTLSISTCFGRIYAWAKISEGWAAVDFLKTCTNIVPPPPSNNPCNSKVVPTAIGQRGLDLIKKWEGLRTCWYRDPIGLPTICYGHLIVAGDPYKSGTCLTQKQCEDLLRKDVTSYSNCVRNYIKVPLNQNQFDALTSFTFNLGCGALQGSGLRTKLNQGSYSSVCGELKRWVYAGGRVLQGLVNRRNEECNLFQSCAGVPTPGGFVDCPAASQCAQCVLNSQADILETFESEGKDTSCSAPNWNGLLDEWCKDVDPWECYHLSRPDVNGTTLCSECDPFPEPDIPEFPDIITNVSLERVGNLCAVDNCNMLVGEDTVCDPTSGECVPGSASMKNLSFFFILAALLLVIV